MSTRVRIPKTTAKAEARLGAIGELVTAHEWERAAILAAYVAPDTGHGGREETVSSDRLSARDFARKGIHGLGSHNTVLRYVNAWLAVRPAPEPGEQVDLTDLPPWPPDEEHTRLDNGPRRAAIEQQARADGVGVGSALRVAESTRAMESAIEADAEVAKAALAALNRRGTRTPSPEHKAFEAQMKAHNDVFEHVVDPVLRAAVQVQQVAEVYDRYERDMTEEDREKVAGALFEIEVGIGALRMHLTLEEQES